MEKCMLLCLGSEWFTPEIWLFNLIKMLVSTKPSRSNVNGEIFRHCVSLTGIHFSLWGNLASFKFYHHWMEDQVKLPPCTLSTLLICNTAFIWKWREVYHAEWTLKFLDLETTKNTFFSKCYGINSCRYITFLIVLTRVSKKRLIYLQSVG